MMISFLRPVMVTKPASSIEPRSPVYSDPSASTSAVASGLFQYPAKTCGPRMMISPSSARRISVPGTGRPIVPILVAPRVLNVPTPADSLRPYPSCTGTPAAWKSSRISGAIDAAPEIGLAGADAQLLETDDLPASSISSGFDQHKPQLRRLLAQLRQLGRLGGVLDDHRNGAGVLDHPPAFLRRAGRVDRHHHGAGHGDTELDVPPFRPRVRQHAHPVAQPDAQRDEAKTDPGGHLAQPGASDIQPCTLPLDPLRGPVGESLRSKERKPGERLAAVCLMHRHGHPPVGRPVGSTVLRALLALSFRRPCPGTPPGPFPPPWAARATATRPPARRRRILYRGGVRRCRGRCHSRRLCRSACPRRRRKSR